MFLIFNSLCLIAQNITRENFEKEIKPLNEKVRLIQIEKNKLSKEFLREWGDIYSDTIELLKWLKVTQRKCDEDVYKCQVFDLMYTCIYIIVRVSDVYYKYSILDYNKDNLERDAAVFESIIFPNIEDDIEFNFSGESPSKVV